jgi:hypothetical protein
MATESTPAKKGLGLSMFNTPTEFWLYEFKVGVLCTLLTSIGCFGDCLANWAKIFDMSSCWNHELMYFASLGARLSLGRSTR